MTNEEIIWKYLYEKMKNPYGVAALMGNLFAESSLNPIRANGIKKLGLTNTEYTNLSDAGKNNFATDNIAYGLAQWCYHTRKEALLVFAKSHNKSVGDINLQLDYLWDELQKYKTVIKALLEATNIKDASDIVLLKYERPANQSDAVKKKRASYGETYFAKYNQSGSASSEVNISLNKIIAKDLYEKLKNVF